MAIPRPHAATRVRRRLWVLLTSGFVACRMGAARITLASPAIILSLFSHHYPRGKYRLPSNVMALITSGCGLIRSANNIGFSRWDPEEQPPLVFEVDEPPGKLVRAPLPPPLPPAAACCRCRLLPLPLVFYPRQRPLPAYCSRCACSPSHGADHAPLCPQTLRVFHKSNFEVSVPPLFVTTHVLRAVHPLFALVV